MGVRDRLTGYYVSIDEGEPIWQEYESEEIAAERKAGYEAGQKYQAMLKAPETLEDVQDAVCELGTLAANSSVSIEDLMDAITELGNLVAELTEVNNG